MMTYKGYTGVVKGIDEENGLFYGWLADIRDVVMFQGATVKDLVHEFHESVDDYLEWAAQDGFTPAKPYSGKFQTRIPAPLHREAAQKAAEAGVSLNELVRTAIQSIVTPAAAAQPRSRVVLDKTTPSPKKPRVSAKSSKPSA